MNQEINNYIERRYANWLEFSEYECSKAGISDESVDVVNEVIIQLYKKDENYLLQLCLTPSKCGRYKELDVLVLRMIYLNIFSPTAPYQHKYKAIPKAKKDLSRLNIPDIVDEDTDHSGYVLERMREIRTLIESMGFSEKAMAIFEYRFFEDGNVKDWPGVEKPKEIYCIYSRIMKLLKKKINGELLI